jgi:hypothetical protein
MEPNRWRLVHSYTHKSIFRSRRGRPIGSRDADPCSRGISHKEVAYVARGIYRNMYTADNTDFPLRLPLDRGWRCAKMPEFSCSLGPALLIDPMRRKLRHGAVFHFLEQKHGRSAICFGGSGIWCLYLRPRPGKVSQSFRAASSFFPSKTGNLRLSKNGTGLTLWRHRTSSLSISTVISRHAMLTH